VGVDVHGNYPEPNLVEAITEINPSILDDLLRIGFYSILLGVVVKSRLKDVGLFFFRELFGLPEAADDSVGVDVDGKGIRFLLTVVDLDEDVVVSLQQLHEPVQIFMVAFDILAVVEFVGINGLFRLFLFSAADNQFYMWASFLDHAAFGKHSFAGER
jgi:hypothetical protein